VKNLFAVHEACARASYGQVSLRFISSLVSATNGIPGT
jgi:hypothetical protein